MLFFGNILASAYKHYEKQKGLDSVFHAKLIVTIIQTLILLLILLLVHEFTSLKVFSFLGSNRIAALGIYALIVLFNLKYYTEQRVFYYIDKFNSKSAIERRSWAVVTGTTPFVIGFLFFLVLRLRHPV